MKIRHGESSRGAKTIPTKEYMAWYGMKSRCYNPNRRSYKIYGGRKISVCNRWRNSYENFLEDMGRAPTPNHSLDRIDNEKSYSPENCRWANATEQNRNRRGNRLTKESAELIRKIYGEGIMSQAKIGIKFGVSQTMIGDIVRGIYWK